MISFVLPGLMRWVARALRLLATHHVFVEVSPDVFANNSLSFVLDTGKSTEALFTQCVGCCRIKHGEVDVNGSLDQNWIGSRERQVCVRSWN